MRNFFLFLSFIFLFFLKESSALNYSPLETGLIEEDLYVILDNSVPVNFFIFKKGEDLITIDTGKNLQVVKKEMEKIGFEPEKVKVIFLTHSDIDHSGALPLFKNAKIYVSSEEISLLKEKFEIRKKNHWQQLVPPEEIIEIKDEQEIEFSDLNFKIKTFLTPGHSSGSLCYLVDDKYLFTGDTVGLKEGDICLIEKIYYTDFKKAQVSFQKISSLQEKVRYIFTSHFGFKKIDFKKSSLSY